ncbi:MAG: DUF1015 domain-containing protein [Cyclobacteriaceae bacterium]
MAEIKPFRAWRYNSEAGKEIHKVISPLFDVVTPDRLNQLYQNPINSIHLSVPNGGASVAGKTLQDWKSNGTLVIDELPGIYVYYQYYTDPYDGTEKVRKGFACNIRVHEWSEGIILHHENTIPGSVSDRLEVLSETGFHASATHGLYSDPTKSLEPYMDEAIQAPLYDSTIDGIRERIAVIHDHSVIKLFVERMSDKAVILADGHHRFEASIQHARSRRAQGDQTPEYHLMFLSNVQSGSTTILPTHRFLTDLAGFDALRLKEKLQEEFYLSSVSSIQEGEWLITKTPKSFVAVFPDGLYLLTLKPGLEKSNPWPFPEKILELDLTILHYFIIEKMMGIPGHEQRKSGKIGFERNAELLQQRIKAGEAQVGFLTRPITVEQVMQVCESGFTLPQKSTWFYPKLNSGYFFSSILPGENRLPDYVQF